jgi:hypothetical protein
MKKTRSRKSRDTVPLKDDRAEARHFIACPPKSLLPPGVPRGAGDREEGGAVQEEKIVGKKRKQKESLGGKHCRGSGYGGSSCFWAGGIRIL